jgi:hypothetical protein
MPIDKDNYTREISHPSYVFGLERTLTQAEIDKINASKKPAPTAAEAANAEKSRKPKKTETPAKVIIGVDLGKEVDKTVIAVIEPTGDSEHPMYMLRRVIPVRLGTTYPDIIRGLVTLDVEIKKMNAREVTYVIDAGGAMGVVDSFEEALPFADIYRVNITGGVNVNVSGLKVGLPKREMITTLMRVLDGHRLRLLGARTGGTELLESELNNFTMKITDSGYDKYEAKTGHDDAVCALALAVWLGEFDAKRGEIKLW